MKNYFKLDYSKLNYSKLDYSKLNYIEKGEKNKDIIIFLHPKLVSNWIWNKQINEFKDYHCFYINLPNETIKNNTKIIEEFIENKILKNIQNNNCNKYDKKYDNKYDKKYDNKYDKKYYKKYDKNNLDIKINLVGIEYGGQIAIELLNNNPKIINKVLLSGINLSNYKNKIKIKEILEKTKKEYLKNKDEKFIIKAYLRYFGINKSYFEDMKKSLNNINDEELYKISNDFLNYNLNPKIKTNLKNFNKNNILITYGTKEELTTQISAFKLKTILEDVNLIQINKGLLLWNINQFELFNKILEEFLKE